MVFAQMDALAQAFTFRQPTTDEQWTLVRECVAGCPHEAVGIASQPLRRDLLKLIEQHDAATVAQIELELSYKDSSHWQSPKPFTAGLYHCQTSAGMDRLIDIRASSYVGLFDGIDAKTHETVCRFDHRCDLLTGFTLGSSDCDDYFIGRIDATSVRGHHLVKNSAKDFQIHTWEMRLHS
jgi:hypothetical protein